MIATSWLRHLVARRDGGVFLFVVIFAAFSALIRLALLMKAAEVASFDASLVAVFAIGAVFDVGTALLFALPVTALLVVLPARFFQWRGGQYAAYAGCLLLCFFLLFGGAAEWLFWDEFGVRFNFIAVDYLVYTQEVVKNIQESYPTGLILGGAAAIAVLGGVLLWRTNLLGSWFTAGAEPFLRRLLHGVAWMAMAVVAGWALDAERIPGFTNNYNRELAKNGVWSLFAAFRNNELDYEQFYPTMAVDDAFKRLRPELAADHSEAVSPNARDTLRFIRAAGEELHPNVIQITVESLSATFLSACDHGSPLMPNLTALANKSLVFDQVYATGTRTDRGMEALTLAIPPTPGRSLLKRPHNENLFTLGSVLRSRGYDTAFIYGGYGYFDNMNYFFGQNGYRVVDRAVVGKEDVTFANAWGACDEDTFRWSLREADAADAAKKPFHHFVMTTSNHRPFTYPEGKIDLPPKLSGRAGAVKYTDYAIGQFLRAAESKPWFRNTVFVIVADHCASVAGRSTLPVQNYHIPLIIYAPGGQVAPGHVSELMSQVDYAPTLLGLLNWSYASRFYGWDVRKAAGDRRALIGNYQKLGLYEPGMLSVLMPVRKAEEFTYDAATFALKAQPAVFTAEAIAYYQTASYMYQHRLYRALSAEEQAHYAQAIR